MAVEAINGVVVTFFSTASAVGKTLLSCNMASELARTGARVCLVDLDLQFGDVCNYLQLLPERTIADAQQMLKMDGESAPIEMCLTPYEHESVSFYVMAAPKTLEEAYNIEVESAQKIVSMLRTYFDYVVVDTTSMFSKLNITMFDLSTIVTFLGIVDFIPTIKNMKIGLDMLRQLNYDREKIRLVLNRSDSQTRISMRDVQDLLGEDFYFVLPNDFRSATQSIKDGVPLVLGDRNGSLSTALHRLMGMYTNRGVEFDREMPRSRRESSSSGGWLGKLFGN